MHTDSIADHRQKPFRRNEPLEMYKKPAVLLSTGPYQLLRRHNLMQPSFLLLTNTAGPYIEYVVQQRKQLIHIATYHQRACQKWHSLGRMLKNDADEEEQQAYEQHRPIAVILLSERASAHGEDEQNAQWIEQQQLQIDLHRGVRREDHGEDA